MVTKKDINYYLNLNWSYTIEEGMENIKEAIEAAIMLYLESHRPIPEPIRNTGS